MNPCSRVLHITLLVLLLIGFSSPAPAQLSPPPARIVNALNDIAKAVQESLNAADTDTATAATELAKVGLSSDPARAILSDLCNKHPSAVDCSTIDPNGIMTAIEPAAYHKFEGSNINTQEQVKRLHQTRKPVLSLAFKAVEGFYAIDLEHPIITRKGEFLGSVSIIMKPQPSLKKTIEPEVSAMIDDVWVMEESGRILFSRYPQSIGDNRLSKPSYVTGPTFDALVREITSTPEGTGHFHTPPVGKTDPALRRCIWKSVSLHGTTWRIALFSRMRVDD